jgi:hypothetical protein
VAVSFISASHWSTWSHRQWRTYILVWPWSLNCYRHLRNQQQQGNIQQGPNCLAALARTSSSNVQRTGWWVGVLANGSYSEPLPIQNTTMYSQRPKHWPRHKKKPLHPIRVITKLPNPEQSNKGKVKTHKYINRQNQSTTGKLWKP